MISGSAPPSTHHTQHEAGGSDEIDATGLAGAGGGASSGEDFVVNLLTDKADRFYPQHTGTAGTTDAIHGFCLYTGFTQDSVGNLSKNLLASVSPLSWDKKTKFLAYVNLDFKTNNIGTAWLVSGWPGNYVHIGFHVTGGKLYGSMYDSSLHTTTEFVDLGAGAFEIDGVLRWELTPGVKVEFYVDGVKLGELDCSSLSGNTYADNYFVMQVENPGTATDKQVIIPYLSFWQEA
jgi:hypothetical protein